MSRYFKRHWDETPGEGLTGSWGTSIFYFETDEDYNVLRQIQIFQNGQILKYDNNLVNDQFGGLADQQLDKNDFANYSIDDYEFNSTWATIQRKII